MNILERDTLNAFCRHTHVALSGSETGPLAGLTFGLKDIYDIAGHHTGFGSPDWLATHPPAHTTASVVTRLLNAGATLVGRTHTEEMAFSLTGENAHYGTPVNPAAPERVPGGSSSGSAAAVAGGLVDFAIGSDTGGSVRGPASFCGIFGIRPTYGRISLDGVLPLAPSFDTCGWFARDGAMLKRIGDVLFEPYQSKGEGNVKHGAGGSRSRTPGQLFLATDAFALATPEANAALQPAVNSVAALLGPVKPAQVSERGLPEWYEVMRVLQFADIQAAHGEWVSRVNPKFGPEIRPRFEAVAKISAAQIAAMQPRRDEIRARLDALLTDNAILLLPSMPDIAPLLRLPSHETVAFRERAIALLCIAGLAGLPQVSLPLATVNGCPLGLSMIAARGNDEMLLEISSQVLIARSSDT